MKDLYKRLGTDADASSQAIGAALLSADPGTQEAARFILLEPRRRAVYDRNRQLLLTIGRLRARLGLNYTRFWARSKLRDFWRELAPPQPPSSLRRGVDAMMIVRAIRAAGRHGRRHAVHWGNWWAAAGVIGALAITAAILWRHGF